MNTLLRTTLGLALLVAGVAAQAATPRADAREQNQQARIDQGVATGQLTAVEAARLDARQEHVENVEARAKADGHVTLAERAKLERTQDRNSRAIARQKHDRQDRHR